MLADGWWEARSRAEPLVGQLRQRFGAIQSARPFTVLWSAWNTQLSLNQLFVSACIQIVVSRHRPPDARRVVARVCKEGTRCCPISHGGRMGRTHGRHRLGSRTSRRRTLRKMATVYGPMARCRANTMKARRAPSAASRLAAALRGVRASSAPARCTPAPPAVCETRRRHACRCEAMMASR